MATHRLGDGDHPAIDVKRHTDHHFFRRFTQPIPRPVFAHQIVVATNATRRDDDGKRDQRQDEDLTDRTDGKGQGEAGDTGEIAQFQSNAQLRTTAG